jgi:predicted TIM-barrel fold metal-dependent hydrolase
MTQREPIGGDLSRREFLKTFAAAGLSAVPPGRVIAQGTRGGRSRTGRVDVHHHSRTNIQGVGGGRGGDWSPARSIEQMDKFGIATAIVSATVPADPFYDGTEKSRSVARRVNEYSAKMAQDYPGRFGLFAALPMPDLDGALGEIAYSFDTLHADGIGIFSSIRDKYPGDPFFDPIWRELNRRRAIVFIHPTVPNCCASVVPGVGPAMVEYDFDTSRSVISLLVNGVLSTYPDMRFIVNHSGATIPCSPAGSRTACLPAARPRFRRVPFTSCRSSIMKSRTRPIPIQWRR